MATFSFELTIAVTVNFVIFGAVVNDRMGL